MTLTATTLAANLGADATEMTVAAAISSDTHERGFVVQIEAEYVLVERRVARTNPQIVRGFLGTERAAHDSGEDVTPVVLVAQTDPPVEPPAETPGGGGGGVTGVTTLTDPGALWEAEHEYVEGDRILALGSIVMEAKEDGLSDTDEPSWDSVANVSDGDISWRALGEIGDIPATILPFGATNFAYTSPSVILGDADADIAIHNDDDGAHDALKTVIENDAAGAITDHNVAQGAHDALKTVIENDAAGAITDHNVAQGAHGLYSGSVDPTAGGGVAASVGSLYRRIDHPNESLWVKTNSDATAWTQLAFVP